MTATPPTGPLSAGARPPRLVLVAAVARGGVIGRDGTMPWHLPGDLAHFRTRTAGRPVLMGRRTWASLPPRFRPLPGRRNLVLTRDAGWSAAGAERVASLDDAIAACAGVDELMVIGGGEVYAAALPRADALVLTEIDADIDGDTRFPDWPRADYDMAERSDPQVDAASGLSYRFVTYARRRVP